jgi:hypothetical protein
VNLEAPIYGVPSHIENWATALAALGAVGSLVYCVRAAVTRRSALPLYLFVGGALTCFIEPFIDTLGHAIFAQEDRISWSSTFGRHIPAYIGLILMFYVAPAYLALLGMFDKGVTSRRFLLFCGAAVASTIVFEVVPMHYDLWRYYGPQGLQIGQVPLWWGFTNAHGLIGTAVLLHLPRRLLPERSLVLLVPLMPVLFVAVHTAGAIPGHLAINSTTSEAAAYVGTLAACGLCSVFFWLYSKAVCTAESPDVVTEVRAREYVPVS